jgi:hypothetical protein
MPRRKDPDDDKPRGLGPCDVLTVTEAVAVLAMRDADGRAWLRARGLIHDVDGRERVICGDLVEMIRSVGRRSTARSGRAVAPVRYLPLTDKF